jgi:hypothetical protein
MPERAKLDTGTPHKGQNRVLRGGSWINDGRNLRSANRNANRPDNRNHNYGLRLAGALWTEAERAGGSINQRCIRFRSSGQTQGPRRVSRLMAEPLPPGRLFLWLTAITTCVLPGLG